MPALAHALACGCTAASMGKKKSKRGTNLDKVRPQRAEGDSKEARGWFDGGGDDPDFVCSDAGGEQSDDNADSDDMSVEVARELQALAGATGAGKRRRQTRTQAPPPPAPPQPKQTSRGSMPSSTARVRAATLSSRQ